MLNNTVLIINSLRKSNNKEKQREKNNEKIIKKRQKLRHTFPAANIPVFSTYGIIVLEITMVCGTFTNILLNITVDNLCELH